MTMNLNSKIIKGALYYVIHKKRICELHKFNNYTIIQNNNINKCNDDQINHKNTCDSKLHQPNSNFDFTQKCAVTFYDNNEQELDEVIEINHNDVAYHMHDEYINCLDPNSKFEVIGVEIAPHIKVGMGIYYTIVINNKTHDVFMGKYIGYDSRLTRNDILNHVRSTNNDSYYTKYDISNITSDDIKIIQQSDSCTLL